MEFSEILAVGMPAIVTVMVAVALIHSWAATRSPAPNKRWLRPGVITVCLLHLLFAGGAYRHLIAGGWLNTGYHWNDPNDFNLVLAVFEALCSLVVIVFTVVRNRFLFKLLVDLLLIQLLFVVGLLILLLIFFLTWKPKMF